MKVIWSERADADFASALTYLEQHSPAGASRIAARIYHSISLLEDFPRIAQPSRHAGLRQMPVPTTPYIVVYKVANDHIEIAAIIHASQRRRR